MWVRIQSCQIVNLDRFRTIHFENGNLLARNGREYQVLFEGDDDCGWARFYQLVDSVTMGLDYLDLS